MKTFFGFALADSMFANCGSSIAILRREISVEEVLAAIAAGVIPCCNPSHKATIDAMRARFGIDVTIPTIPPRIELKPSDAVIVMGVRGLPRLTDRHEYTNEEVAEATFEFARYDVVWGGEVRMSLSRPQQETWQFGGLMSGPISGLEREAVGFHLSGENLEQIRREVINPAGGSLEFFSARDKRPTYVKWEKL